MVEDPEDDDSVKRATIQVQEEPVIGADPDLPPKMATITVEDVAHKEDEHHAAATTTREEDRVTAGQRLINLTWEDTQKKIALSVTWVALSVASWLSVMGETESLQTAALVFVFGVANLVIGFYFGRTNHQRTGGVGERDFDATR